MNGPNTSNQSGHYGTQGVPATANYPAPRCEVSASWVDKSGSLWLFGGRKGGVNFYNDLWKYDVGTNMWTWIRGDTIPNSAGNYGSLGVSAATNDPAARGAYARWVDAQGNLWFFGGTKNYTAFFNDLWKYDVSSNQWTWMSGSNFPNDTAVAYPAPCTAVSTAPFARGENRAAWSDSCGNLWMWGGAVTPSFQEQLNDLWYYNIQTNKWVWASGNSAPNSPGSYGTMGVPSPSNMPPPRTSSIPFKKNNTLWLFGGLNTYQNIKYYNDLWQYVPDTACIHAPVKCSFQPHAGFTSSLTSGCAPLTVNFINTSQNSNSWTWYFGDSTTSNSQNPAHTYTHAGQYTISLTASDGLSTDSVIYMNYITVFPSPAASFIQNPDSVCVSHPISFTNSSNSAVSYSWLFGDGNNSSVQNPSYAWTAAGQYTVELIATNQYGCTDTNSHAVSVFPLPAASFLGSDTVCVGQSLTFSNTSQFNAANWWTFGDGSTSTVNNPIHVWNTSGQYTVGLLTTNAIGCKDSTSRTVTVLAPLPVTAFFSATPQIGCSPEQVIFTNGSVNANSWLWSFGDGSTSTAASPVHAYYSGQYTVILWAYSNMACTITDSLSAPLTIQTDSCGPPSIHIPNIFSPNNDGINDYFEIQTFGYLACHLEIYDRWGVKLLETDGTNPKWNGKNVKGADVADGTYYYLLRAEDKDHGTAFYKGFLTLIR
jgi:gliding motility-associated-like protein